MKKSTRNVQYSIIICFSTLLFFVISPDEKVVELKKKKNEQSAPKVANQNKASIKRTPASITKNNKTPRPKKQVIGANALPPNVVFSNKDTKDGINNYKKRFLNLVGPAKVKNLNVKHKKSVVKVKNNIGTHLEHLVVSYQGERGPFSFEVMIDSETGAVIQTWNQTHYEVKKPFKVDASKYRYYGK